MKSYFRTNSLVFHLSLSLFLLACSTSKSENEVENISTNQAHEILVSNQNAEVLDVRTPEEFDAGHIQGAININIYDETFADKASTLDKEKTYIVHCAANVANGRSDKSIQILKELGFKKIKSMDGGFKAWSKDGFTVETN